MERLSLQQMDADWSKLIDLESRTVSPRVFVDPAIYEIEQERIFNRCWLFVGCESQVPNPGDFFTNSMGEEPVIVTRAEDGKIHVFINSCRHRGSRVCRIEHGNARSFTCPYHGWTYDLRGKLTGVPRLREAYYGDLDRDQWGLLEAPKVESYCGLIFACLDSGAQSFESYLGNAKWYLDILFNRTPGGAVALPGVHKWNINGNWKINSEQQAGDNYHTDYLHRSMLEVDFVDKGFRGGEPWVRDFEVKADNGHGFMNLAIGYVKDYPEAIIEYEKRVHAEAIKHLAPEQAKLVYNGNTHVANIFPNLSIISFAGFTSVRVNHPREPMRHEIWSVATVDRDAPEVVRAYARDMQNRTFSSTGIFEQDDGEMWADASRTLRGSYRRRFPLNYQMGAGHGRKLPEKPGLIHPPNTEISVFNLYERWFELMSRAE
ncbi:aromatic ring-hydroxylating oxygenase subunit alpha [Candidatus Binatus sp.]|uniref:aromatic ring-hydroxylating oxygenase subunit alpha n=3 Tax=Candidatus Binatus sp. TaxID=2811406 RepID=UPI003CC6D718